MNINALQLINRAWLLCSLVVVLFVGLLVSTIGILLAPVDYLQGISSKIMFLHVPAAWLSLAIFVAMAVFSGLFLITKNPIWHISAVAVAPIGMIYTAIALITGSLWGKPTWGTFWVWDARLTAMLLELFLYIIYLLLNSMPNHPNNTAHNCSYFALVAALNIPVIKFSVYIWNTLHQKSSVLTVTGPKIDWHILWVLLCCFATLVALTLLIAVIRLRTITLLNKWKRSNELNKMR